MLLLEISCSLKPACKKHDNMSSSEVRARCLPNVQVQMNALFVADSVREEVTWIGALGMVIKDSQYKDSDVTTIRFDASKKTILIGDDVALMAQNIDRLTFGDGKLSISEANRGYNCTCYGIQVELKDVGLNFSVHFIKNNHLDMAWNNVEYFGGDSHGLIGKINLLMHACRLK